MKRELIVTADGRDRDVVVEGPLDDGRFRVTIDGAATIVDARAVRAGTWSLIVFGSGSGESLTVDLDHRRGGVVATVGASEIALQVEDALHRKLARAAGTRATAARGEQVRAPIAGKVVKVLHAVGDTVAPGAAVIVLEAMKMENELASERGGTITAVHKQAGQAVETGEVLVELA